MDLTVTLGLAAGFLILTVLFGWIGARPAKPLAPPRLVPWRLFMLLAFVGMIATLVHVVALVRGVSGSSPS
jgi:drug/metabolite transporter (DMT)-like permease